MLAQFITFLVCGLPLITIVIVSAILGDMNRRRLTQKLMAGMREGRFNDFSTKGGARKVQWYALLSLVTTTGVIVILILIEVKILSYNSKWFIVLIILLPLIGIIVATLLLKQFLNRLK